MKKLIFSMLCILSSALSPVYKVVNPMTGDPITNNGVPIELNLQQVPSFAELCAELAQLKPELVFEGLINNAHLLVGTVELSPNNTAASLAGNAEIGLVAHADMIKLPMGDTLWTKNVHCEFLFAYLNAYSAAQNRAHAERIYDFWLRRGISNIMYSLLSGSGCNLLEEMTPHLKEIRFSCEKDNSKLTIIYNPSALNPLLNGRRRQPWRMLTNIYNHINYGKSLSSITQTILDLDNDESPGSWIIEE